MIHIFETAEEASKAIAGEMGAVLKHEESPVFCLASGNTPERAYRLFAEKSETAALIGKAAFVGLDEWAGVSAAQKGSCRQMMNDALFNRLDVSGERISFFDGTAVLEAECRKADEFVERRGITFGLMGVGVNGHIGFNEPELPFSEQSAVVPLSAMTREVGKKYFGGGVPAKYGITLGLGQIIGAKRVIVALFGANKAAIARELLDGMTSSPAGKLLGYEHIAFFMDREAAGERP